MVTRKARYRIVTLLSGIVLFSLCGATQTTSTHNPAQLFQAYFDALAAEPHTPQRPTPNEAARERLAELIPTLTTAELQQVVPIIDTAIDQARASHDGIARVWAGMFLFYISGAKDGPSLLAPEVSRISALCRDPFTLTGSVNMFGFLRFQYPELTIPAMLEAIKAPDVNSPTGKGPAYATILLLQPQYLGLEKDVLLYMQRPDLTGESY